MDIPPCPTIYVKNLNDKIRKDELRRTLYGLFSQFGGVMDVVAIKNDKMRGQAFIVFKDVGCASNALRSMQGFTLYEKKMSIQFAKSKSYATMKEEGSLSKHLAQKRKGKLPNNGKTVAATTKSSDGQPAAKAPKLSNGTADHGGSDVPNAIVYCSNLPDEASEEMLQMLFGQVPGLKEVRQIEGRPDIAFVEFETEAQATMAVSALNGFKVDETHNMAVSYAKK
eukprot:TRINITY_DN4232_c0_g1_i1.p1 TRINITY_DN4232_c0_g1~~TRINITY_DN4232_c0_g1_i1.p1  ORF type:complete len:225 (+),score=46.58 TRINITY_DN4232_c0_g1_i1:117-791(+)